MKTMLSWCNNENENIRVDSKEKEVNQNIPIKTKSGYEIR